MYWLQFFKAGGQCSVARAGQQAADVHGAIGAILQAAEGQTHPDSQIASLGSGLCCAAMEAIAASPELDATSDAHLDQLEAAMPPAKYAVGHFQYEQNADFFSSPTFVWQPEMKADAAKMATFAKYDIETYPLKGLTVFSGFAAPLLMCIQGCQKKVVSMPAGDSVVIADAATKPAVKPAGAVVIVHGMSGHVGQLAHYAEALAARGYLVVLPTFDDSSLNNVKVNPSLGGVRNRITRCWHIQCCLEWVHARYGDLSVGLLGHSLGTNTIVRMRGNYPKVFLAGPNHPLSMTPYPMLEVGYDTAQHPGASTSKRSNRGLGTDFTHVLAGSSAASCCENAGRADAVPLTLEHCTSGSSGATYTSLNSRTTHAPALCCGRLSRCTARVTPPCAARGQVLSAVGGLVPLVIRADGLYWKRRANAQDSPSSFSSGWFRRPSHRTESAGGGAVAQGGDGMGERWHLGRDSG